MLTNTRAPFPAMDALPEKSSLDAIEAEMVLDPFMGSGTTGLPAKGGGSLAMTRPQQRPAKIIEKTQAQERMFAMKTARRRSAARPVPHDRRVCGRRRHGRGK